MMTMITTQSDVPHRTPAVRVLIAEDDPTSRMLLSAVLRKSDISALGATSTANLWLPNYKVKRYKLEPGLRTFEGQTLEAGDMTIIPGANAIVLTEE